MTDGNLTDFASQGKEHDKSGWNMKSFAVIPSEINHDPHEWKCINCKLGPSTLAVLEQLSNGRYENMGHSPPKSGTDFWAHFHH